MASTGSTRDGASIAKKESNSVSGPVDSRSRLPLIDSHVHLTPLDGPMNFALRLFSQVGVEKFAVKSAGIPGGPRYKATLRYAQYLGESMAFFSNLNWDGIDDPNWGHREAARLAQAMRDGASGVKIFKALGLGVRLKDGSLLKVDDPRLESDFSSRLRRRVRSWRGMSPIRSLSFNRSRQITSGTTSFQWLRTGAFMEKIIQVMLRC